MFATALMDMKMFEAVSYLKDMVDKFLEAELDEITALLQQKQDYCKKVREHLQNSLTRATNRCIGKEGWLIQSSQTNSIVVREIEGKGKYEREHAVVIEAGNGIPVSCSCRFFKSIEIPCCGIVAALKYRGDDPFDSKWLCPQWLLMHHPLATTALQRLGVRIVDDHSPEMENDFIGEEPTMTQARLRNRVDKVMSIVYPDQEKVRFATMTNAFNCMRDEYRPYNNQTQYKAVMAAIFDLGASFRGSPGQWLQEPPRLNDKVNVWDRQGALQVPPANFAQSRHKRSLSVTETRQEYNKKWKDGKCPTHDDLRATKQDWTLFRPAGTGPTWTCPLPGCTKRPIKNTDQARYAHRLSHGHKHFLVKYPNEASVTNCSPVVGSNSSRCAAVSDGVDKNSSLSEDNAPLVHNATTGIPQYRAVVPPAVGSESSFRAAVSDVVDISSPVHEGVHMDDTGIPGPPSRVPSDSFEQAVYDAAELGTHMTPIEKAHAIGMAAVGVHHDRGSRKKQATADWVNFEMEIREVPQVIVDDSIFLPFMTAKNMEHLRVNQFCEQCSTQRLCDTHQSMVPKKKVADFTPLHMDALRKSGRALVECGGAGDCFYHSVLWLMQLFEPKKASRYVDHVELRAATTSHLKNKWSQLKVPAGDVTVDMIAILRARPSGARTRTDQQCVDAFVKAHTLSARLSATGKKTPGTYVENEVICAFTHLVERPVVVTSYNADGPIVFAFDSMDARVSPYHVWCTGGHYQAILPLQGISVRASVVNEFAFTQSNVLQCGDVVRNSQQAALPLSNVLHSNDIRAPADFPGLIVRAEALPLPNVLHSNPTDFPSLPWLRQCNSDESRIVADMFARDSDTKIHTEAADADTEVHLSDLQCLRPGKWLNSATINSYLAIALKRAKEKGVEGVHIANSFFMQKMDGTISTNKSLLRGFNKIGVRICDLKMLLLPYNIDNVHWVAIVCNVQSRAITSFDSLTGSHHDALLKLKMFLESSEVCSTNDTAWKIMQRTDEECRQHNGYDCGIFTAVQLVLHMLSLEQHAHIFCNQSVIDGMRQRMAHDIFMTNFQLE